MTSRSNARAVSAGAAAILLAGPLVAQRTLPPTGFEVGEPFPALSFPTLDGETLSVADFRGHRLILHVFASW